MDVLLLLLLETIIIIIINLFINFMVNVTYFLLSIYSLYVS